MTRQRKQNKWEEKRYARDHIRNRNEQRRYNDQVIDQMKMLSAQIDELNNNFQNLANNLSQSMMIEIGKGSEIVTGKLDTFASQLKETQNLIKLMVANELIDELDSLE